MHFHSHSGCGRACLWKYRIAEELYVCIYIYIFVCVCTHTCLYFLWNKWSLLLKPGEMIWCGRNVKITGYTLSGNRQKGRLIATLYWKILLLLPSVKRVLILMLDCILAGEKELTADLSCCLRGNDYTCCVLMKCNLNRLCFLNMKKNLGAEFFGRKWWCMKADNILMTVPY